MAFFVFSLLVGFAELSLQLPTIDHQTQEVAQRLFFAGISRLAAIAVNFTQ